MRSRRWLILIIGKQKSKSCVLDAVFTLSCFRLLEAHPSLIPALIEIQRRLGLISTPPPIVPPSIPPAPAAAPVMSSGMPPMRGGIAPGPPPFTGLDPYFDYGFEGPAGFQGPPHMDNWGPPLPMQEGLQRQMLLDQAMTMSDEELFRLPPDRRAQIIQLRMQFARGY